MNQDSIRELQVRVNSQKQKISEVHKNANQTIEITINGHFEITKMYIQKQVTLETIEKDLPLVITKGIKSVSEKIHHILVEFQAANS
jgi:hypothetical protein